MTLVDDQQIDCIIRQEVNGHLRCVDIQIKARSNLCVQKDGGFFPAMHIRCHIFSPSSLSFINASALPRASSTGLWVWRVTRYFFHSVALYASLTKPA